MQRPQLAGLVDLLNFPTCLDSVFLCLFDISAIGEKQNKTLPYVRTIKSYIDKSVRQHLHYHDCLSRKWTDGVTRPSDRMGLFLTPWQSVPGPDTLFVSTTVTWLTPPTPHTPTSQPPNYKIKNNKNQQQLNEANVISWSISWILQAGKPQSDSTGSYQPVSIMGYISPGKIH